MAKTKKSATLKNAVDSFFTASDWRSSDLQSAKEEWSSKLFKPETPNSFMASAASVNSNQNVVGIGVGEKIVSGKYTGILAIKFFVKVKYPPGELNKNNLLPVTISGLPTDVEQVGTFRKFPDGELQMPNPRTKFRPAQPGCSIGFRDPDNQIVMAGNFGALVKDANGIYLLSNNHVLADENRLPAGAPIFQPGLLDGGSITTDQIATLDRFIPLEAWGWNKTDVALAKLDREKMASNATLFIGAPGGVTAAQLDMTVHKFGRTTGYSVGRVTSIDTDVNVDYATGQYAFKSQIIITGLNSQPFSAGGDSGSLILNRADNQAIGLLFAGSSTHTIANHLNDVLTATNVSLV
ncbi:MAG: hypothetical protein ABI151_07820 [Chitinophagaceae bacterium]